MNIHPKIKIVACSLFFIFSNILSNDFEAYQTLFVAIQNNDVHAAQQALDSHINLNIYTVDGFTPLHAAILQQSYDVAELLINYGANVYDKINYKYHDADAFVLALKLQDTVMLNLLINANMGITYKTVIQHAICEHLNQLAQEFMIIYNDVYATSDEDGNTTLHYAASYNNYLITFWLLEQNIEINTLNDSNETALHLAVTNNATDVVQLFIDYHADLNAQNNFGETPLFLTIQQNCYEIAEQLIQAGADVNQADFYAITPLFEAYYEENYDFIKLLVVSGAYIDQQDESGNTILHLLAEDLNCNDYGDYYLQEIIDFLIEHGADLTLQNNDGQTAQDLLSCTYHP